MFVSPSPSLTQSGASAAPAAPGGQPNAQTSAVIAGTPRGSGGQQVQDRVAPWTRAESDAQQVLKDQLGLTTADANRWAKLERIESNLRPVIGNNVNDSTNRYVNSLQSRLTDTSYARAVALNEIRMLEQDQWSSVPFTRQNGELNEARRNVESFDRVLDNTRTEIDALLLKHPDLLTRPATDPNPPRIM